MKYFQTFQQLNENLTTYITVSDLQTDIIEKIVKEHIASKTNAYFITLPGLGVINRIKATAEKFSKFSAFSSNGFDELEYFKDFLENAITNTENQVIMFDNIQFAKLPLLEYLKELIDRKMEKSDNETVFFFASSIDMPYVNKKIFKDVKTYRIISDNEVWRKNNSLSDLNDKTNGRNKLQSYDY